MMSDLTVLIWLYTKIFFLLLVFAYLIPAGIAYGYFYRWRQRQWANKHIQADRYSSLQVMKRDVQWSISSVAIFAFLTTAIYLAQQNGYTKIYTDPQAYGRPYLVLSFFLFLFTHDTYFYWVHRFMHWPPVYRYIHRIHHLTTTPTPWTIFAFQPLEAILQYAIVPIVIFTFPIHYVVLILALVFNIVNNVAGHSGFEVVPEGRSRHWLGKYNNTVTHHDLHHSKFHCNYSQYFNIWDRLMNTYQQA